MIDDDLPTPDFYRYPWVAPRSAHLNGRFAEVVWPDGLMLRAFDLWLAENTMGQAIDLATRESVVDPADLDDGLAIADVEIDDTGALALSWQPDGHRSRFHPGWLRHVAEGRHLPAASLPTPRPWLASEFDQPPTRDGTEVLGDDRVLVAWLEDVVTSGLGRLTGVGIDPDLLATLAGRIGAIRDTNFGPIWSVRADPDPTSTANTNRRLVPHTDLPTRETPPGFQFLHCLANSAAGGWSTMTDGLALVDHLATEHPDHHEALTTLKWVFFNRGPTVDHRWSGPIIDHQGGDQPLTIRAFHPVRGFPEMADEDLPRAYDALRCFSQLAADPRFQIRYPFVPGHLAGFDNRRILHGRDHYETSGAGGGHRHLRGLYVDHDEIHSFLRLAYRRAGEPAG